MPTTKGIMGYMRLSGGGVTSPVSDGLRVTSFDLKASQDVSAMETIDNNYDYTAYRYGPVRVEGSVGFPVPVADDFFSGVVKFAAERDGSSSPTGGSGSGNLLTTGATVEAQYDHTIGYQFKECKPNTLSVSIAAEEALDFSLSFIGTSREVISSSPKLTRISPERMLTWNDIAIVGGGGTAGGIAPNPWDTTTFTDAPGQIRNFSFEINNNLTAFFGLNGKIFVQANNIVAGKREITGSMEIAWNGSGLSNFAYLANTNTAFCTSVQEITMEITSKGAGGSAVTVPLVFLGVIFNMEDISMTNDFFMGTQTWRAYGDEARGYKALLLDGATL
jgi:hypothetical protein